MANKRRTKKRVTRRPRKRANASLFGLKLGKWMRGPFRVRKTRNGPVIDLKR